MTFDIWNRRYTGSKYKLSGWIVDLIHTNCSGKSFCDIFAGTAIMSKQMLNSVEEIYINDFLYSNRKNLNANVPLVLLLQVIKLLKDDPEENDAGIFRSELSLLICWRDNNATALYNRIKELRREHQFIYGDEVIYDICLDLLGATDEQRNKFKMNQITGEAVDEFIRKMRITGVISLRGNGRFIDFNSFESEKIEYILSHYAEYDTFTDKNAYFRYMETVDTDIVTMVQPVNEDAVNDVRTATLNQWAEQYSKEEIIHELNLVCGNGESRNPVLRIINKPTRLEFLTSIALKQQFETLYVKPNYHVDDEGLPTFTASGGLADIECFDTDCNPLVEVTLMCARNQATNEIPAITRHLNEAVANYPEITIFTIFVAPSIHADTTYMAEFSKYRDNVDIIPMTVAEFIEKITISNRIIEFI